MLINHLSRLCHAPHTPHPPPQAADAPNRIVQDKVAPFHRFQASAAKRPFSSRQMDLKDKRQMMGLDFLLFTWGGGGERGKETPHHHHHSLTPVAIFCVFRGTQRGSNTFSAAKEISCNWDKSTVLHPFSPRTHTPPPTPSGRLNTVGLSVGVPSVLTGRGPPEDPSQISPLHQFHVFQVWSRLLIRFRYAVTKASLNQVDRPQEVHSDSSVDAWR